MKEVILIKNRKLFKIVSGQYEYWSKSKKCYLWGNCRDLVDSNGNIIIHNLPTNPEFFLNSLGYTIVPENKLEITLNNLTIKTIDMVNG